MCKQIMIELPKFLGLYLFVNDLPRTLAFYELLGFGMERLSPVFARASWRIGVVIESRALRCPLAGVLCDQSGSGWKLRRSAQPATDG
ncbi:MAG: hypothetical protein ACJAR0_004415 [Candidatus Azotimanducaceae bacterium]|jgi:hypothetical protein